LLVLVFRSSGHLAAAYGIAVTGTMFITTCMLAVLTFSGMEMAAVACGAGHRRVPAWSTGSISRRT